MTASAYPIDIAHVRDGHPATGWAVLVDRLWPRGQRKADAPWDEWCKQLAPSTELRRWYGHDPAKRDEFARRYRDELAEGDAAAALEVLRKRHRDGPLTLLTATHDLDTSHAHVLAELVR